MTFSRPSEGDKAEEEEVVVSAVVKVDSAVDSGARDADAGIGVDAEGVEGIGQVIGESSIQEGAFGGAPFKKGCNLGGEEAISGYRFDFGVRKELDSVLGTTEEG